MSTLSTLHPCLSCGACCAFFRVSFHWSETGLESHGVPIALTTQINPYMNAMNGTDQEKPSCVALEGVIGKAVSCSIYEKRPDCCRSFSASFEDGTHNEACDRARSSKGLNPLTTSDFL